MKKRFIRPASTPWYACVGDVVILPRDEYKDIKGMGKLTLVELEQVLASHELRLGLHIPGWPLTFTSSWNRGREYPLPLGSRLEVVDFYDASRLRAALGLP
jgi:hypothetical protein